jgi:hypothetical protein
LDRYLLGNDSFADGAPCLAVLHQQRPRGVRQVGAINREQFAGDLPVRQPLSAIGPTWMMICGNDSH